MADGQPFHTALYTANSCLSLSQCSPPVQCAACCCGALLPDIDPRIVYIGSCESYHQMLFTLLTNECEIVARSRVPPMLFKLAQEQIPNVKIT